MKCQIKTIDKEVGKGLFAVELIDKGEGIFSECPIVSSQFLWSKTYNYTACDFCLKSLENANDMACRLSQNDTIKLPHSELVSNKIIIQCPNCEDVYCSQKCLEFAYQTYHKTLCKGGGNINSETLDELESFWKSINYPPESTSIVIVLKIMACVIQADNPVKVFENFNQFCSKTSSNDNKIMHKLLGDSFSEHIEIVRKLIINCIEHHRIYSEWLTKNGFNNLLAMLGTNQQGIGTSSVDEWVRKCDSLELEESEQSNLDEFIDALYEQMYEASGEFLKCEGTGLYLLQSSCNHSCQPNAEVEFLENSNKLTLTATQTIKPGEEIKISYISDCELSRSKHSRQKHLMENYLFKCNCEKCIQEKDAPDVTSDESEED